jgi:hypothetical protein
VRNLTKAIALLMVAFWGLVTVHCSLEQLPGFEFLSCCEHPGTAPHQDNDCKQDGCSVVESGFYRADEHLSIVPEPLLLLAVLLPVFEPEVRSEVPITATVACTPSELSQVWQFSFRTALLPRAPSFMA